MKIYEKTHFIDLDTNMTPDDLRCIANDIEEAGYISICLYIDADDYNCSLEEIGKREETEKERLVREAKESKDAKNKRKQDSMKKIKLIEEAKKLGLKVSESHPIESSYDHVYYVTKGMVLEPNGFVANKNGYVWYDEAGLLGTGKVYPTALAANRALSKYCKEAL